MVHALEITRGLLRDDGVAVNIQPAGSLRALEIHSGGDIMRTGPIGHRLNHENHKSALRAMETAVRGGLFRLDQERTIDFLYHAPSVDVFAEWLAKNSSNSIFEPQTAERAREIEADIGQDYEVIMRAEIYIGRLKPA